MWPRGGTFGPHEELGTLPAEQTQFFSFTLTSAHLPGMEVARSPPLLGLGGGSGVCDSSFMGLPQTVRRISFPDPFAIPSGPCSLIKGSLSDLGS